jgi:hypothetical protein
MKNDPLKVLIKKDDNEPIEKEVLERAIIEISKGVIGLNKSGLIREDLLVLIARRCRQNKVTKSQVGYVLEGIDKLVKDYVSKK